MSLLTLKADSVFSINCLSCWMMLLSHVLWNWRETKLEDELSFGPNLLKHKKQTYKYKKTTFLLDLFVTVSSFSPRWDTSVHLFVAFHQDDNKDNNKFNNLLMGKEEREYKIIFYFYFIKLVVI